MVSFQIWHRVVLFYLFCICELLQHILSHGRRREIHYEDEDIDGGSLCSLVLRCQCDFECR